MTETIDEMTFDQALDRVIGYLGDEADHYAECSPRERRDHIWRAVEVLMRYRRQADLSEFHMRGVYDGPYPAALGMDDYFGTCPVCHETDGYLNAGKSHVFYCKEHKKSWSVGSNLFSTWKDETEAEQRQKWAEVGMDNFEDITGHAYHGEGRDRQVDQDELDGPIPF